MAASGLHDEVEVLRIIGRPEAYEGVAVYPTQAKTIEAILVGAHEGADEER